MSEGERKASQRDSVETPPLTTRSPSTPELVGSLLICLFFVFLVWKLEQFKHEVHVMNLIATAGLAPLAGG